MSAQYHKYVWDHKAKTLIGDFEGMYQAEESEGFDSWHQDDPIARDHQFHLDILRDVARERVLDLGCGKGLFTSQLKTATNQVTGVDVSPTAIAKAKARYPGVEFHMLTVDQALGNGGSYDLVVAMALLYYLKNWREVVARLGTQAAFLYVTVNIPPNSIAYIQSAEELREVMTDSFTIERWVEKPERDLYCVLARSKDLQ